MFGNSGQQKIRQTLKIRIQKQTIGRHSYYTIAKINVKGCRRSVSTVLYDKSVRNRNSGIWTWRDSTSCDASDGKRRRRRWRQKSTRGRSAVHRARPSRPPGGWSDGPRSGQWRAPMRPVTGGIQVDRRWRTACRGATRAAGLEPPSLSSPARLPANASTWRDGFETRFSPAQVNIYIFT